MLARATIPISRGSLVLCVLPPTAKRQTAKRPTVKSPVPQFTAIVNAPCWLNKRFFFSKKGVWSTQTSLRMSDEELMVPASLLGVTVDHLYPEDVLKRYRGKKLKPKGGKSRLGLGLRSAGGKSGAQAERRGERSRSATPPPSRRWKPATDAANPLPLVTDAVFAKRNRRGRRGNGATAKPVE